MPKIEDLLTKLEASIPAMDRVNTSVSTSSVGWHIEHSLLTINVIVEAIKKSDPAKYSRRFNLKRSIIFAIKRFPRGKAKSPNVVEPKIQWTARSLQFHVDKTRARLKELEGLAPNLYFDHPIFGQLNLRPSIIFLGIHTRHHLLIINDIVGGNAVK